RHTRLTPTSRGLGNVYKGQAQWKPECIGVDSGCTKAQMINSYDNSVTYVDHFITSVFDQLRDKKAIVFYAADH
ncbi:sulfatase-like hydrolase/transferase, partial [Salmonella enterica subsp. enterica serovar Paratyphi B]|uniref:sulfatase-like hydrolase/transferase n=1 Tax=Salmonella enterica TaxID=28901 RepID=UPI0030C79811